MNSAHTSPDSRIDVGRLMISLSLLALAGITSLAGSLFIAARYPDRPTPRDTLFELLPYVNAARYLTAVALVAGFVLFIAWALRSSRADIPRFVAVFALMYLARSVLIVLTPLANSHGEGPFVFPVVQNGMFPSGHAAAALLFVRLTDAARAPNLKRTLLALAVVVWVALVVSHGHYSIDVVGGLLLAYFVDREWTHGSLFGPVKRLVSPQTPSDRIREQT